MTNTLLTNEFSAVSFEYFRVYLVIQVCQGEMETLELRYRLHFQLNFVSCPLACF